MIYVLFATSIIAKYFCDRIRFRADFRSDWMIGTGRYRWDKRTWLTKNIFSFVSDGWHFFDAVRVMSLCVIVSLSLQISVFWSIGFYIIHGTVFEILYRIK